MLSSYHSDIVKNLHKSLRVKFKNGLSENEIWTDLLKNDQMLSTYSSSMHELATSSWEMNKNNRILWCRNTIWQYFSGNGLQKVLKKEEKTRLYQELRERNVHETCEEKKKIDALVDGILVDYQSQLDKKLLLDVGSCYNPFKILDDCYSFAIDIAPATKDVLFCDFLNVDIVDSKSKINLDIIKVNLQKHELISGIFDVVIFSLLLSYFPSPKQRLRCCINAHSLLQVNGILLIVTPDSSHQNKHTDMMKSWKSGLEYIGFSRFKYEKLDHLHCMAYRKSCKSRKFPIETDLEKAFYIPQDFQEIKKPVERKSEQYTYDHQVFGDLEI